jgi:hypothetical protein
MPWIIKNRPSGYGPAPQTDATASDGHNAVELGASPTLQGLLSAFSAADGDPDAPLRAQQDEGRVRIVVPTSPNAVPSAWTRFKAALSNLPLFNRSAALRAARLEVDEVPLAQHQAAEIVLRNGILDAIRQELGDAAADMATSDMDAKPLTKRTVQCVLGNAVDKAKKAKKAAEAAEELRLRQATLRRTHSPEARRDEGEILQLERPMMSQPDASLPLLRASLRKFMAGRHDGLLEHCAVLVDRHLGDSSSIVVAKAAKDLHDRVQAYLAERGQWPIADEADFEDEIKPLAAVMLTQGV